VFEVEVMLSVEDFVDDLEYFQLLVALRPSDGDEQLRALYQRYCAASPSAPMDQRTLSHHCTYKRVINVSNVLTYLGLHSGRVDWADLMVA
jgi:hypothetical protein